MSILSERNSMNLHEECLLKYLINPMELFYTTELLKSNNLLLRSNFDNKSDDVVKIKDVNYNIL